MLCYLLRSLTFDHFISYLHWTGQSSLEVPSVVTLPKDVREERGKKTHSSQIVWITKLNFEMQLHFKSVLMVWQVLCIGPTQEERSIFWIMEKRIFAGFIRDYELYKSKGLNI